MTAGEPPLCGRTRELAALHAALDDLAAGQGGVLLLTGEAGAGKTRLAAALLTEARVRGYRAGWGRAARDASWSTAAPWEDALRDAGLDPAALPPADHASNAETGPSPAAGPPPVHLPTDLESILDRLRIRASGGHLVLVLDDIDRAGPEALALFIRAAHLAAGLPFLLAVTLHGACAPPEANRAVAEAARARRARTLTVPCLDMEATANLLGHLMAVSCPSATVAAVYRRTGGNPLLVLELGRQLEDEPPAIATTALPAALVHWVAARQARLSDRCQSLLRTAAVLGETIHPELLAAVCGLDLGPTLEALEPAERAGFLAASPDASGQLCFQPPITREALAAAVPALQAAQLHLRAAAALEQASVQPDAARLAGHYNQALVAGGGEPALRHALAAAEQAVARNDHAQAARYYGFAVQAQTHIAPHERGRRCDLLLREGQAAARAGLRGPATTAALAAAGLARDLDDPTRLAAAALIGDPAWTDDPRLLDLLTGARHALPPRCAVLRLRLLLHGVRLQGRPDHQIQDIERAAAAGETDRDPSAPALVLAARYLARWQPHTLDHRLPAGAALLVAAGADTDLERMALQWRTLDLAQAGHVDELRSLTVGFTALAARTRLRSARWSAGCLTAALAIAGNEPEGAAWLAARREQAREPLSPPVESISLLALAFIHCVGRDEPASVSPFLTPAVQRLADDPTVAPLLAATRLASSDQDVARTIYEQWSAGNFAALPHDSTLVANLVLWAMMCVRLKDVQRAGPLLRRLTPFSGQVAVLIPGYGILGAVDRAAGLLAMLLGRPHEAAGHFELALHTDDRAGARVWAVHTRIDYAALLLSRAQPHDFEDSQRLAEEALEQAIALNLPGPAERARTLAARAAQARRLTDTMRRGLRGRLAHPGDLPLPDHITRREAEILGAIAAGQHNTEIAAALHLSPLTVARHITNLYAKIGARGRADATAYALRSGLYSLAEPLSDEEL